MWTERSDRERMAVSRMMVFPIGPAGQCRMLILKRIAYDPFHPPVSVSLCRLMAAAPVWVPPEVYTGQ